MENVELIERISMPKRRGQTHLFIVGMWHVWHKRNEFGERTLHKRRIFTWRAKDNREWVLKALDKYLL